MLRVKDFGIWHGARPSRGTRIHWLWVFRPRLYRSFFYLRGYDGRHWQIGCDTAERLGTGISTWYSLRVMDDRHHTTPPHTHRERDLIPISNLNNAVLCNRQTLLPVLYTDWQLTNRLLPLSGDLTTTLRCEMRLEIFSKACCGCQLCVIVVLLTSGIGDSSLIEVTYIFKKSLICISSQRDIPTYEV